MKKLKLGLTTIRTNNKTWEGFDTFSSFIGSVQYNTNIIIKASQSDGKVLFIGTLTEFKSDTSLKIIDIEDNAKVYSATVEGNKLVINVVW